MRRGPSPPLRQPAPAPGRASGNAPTARSELEATFFAALHPCSCGRGDGAALRASVVGVGIERSGTCRSCGRHRRFVFRGPLVPGTGHSFGPGTSDLLDAAEWLWLAGRTADLSGVATSDSPSGRATVQAIAADAVRQAIAFIPSGQDRVPDEAFWSARGRVLRVADPDAFTRARLLAELLRHDPTAGDHSIGIHVHLPGQVEGGLLGDLRRADRAVPDERRHVGERSRGSR